MRFALSAALAASLLGTLALTGPAYASPAAQTTTQDGAGTLDPATYEGTMEVATPSGGVVVEVRAGEALEVAKRVREAAAMGEADKYGTLLPAGVSCGDRVNSVAGPATYWDSIDGCAVFGYPGYQRGYRWFNTSSVTICASGRGYNSKGASGWYSAGCLSGGASTTRMIPWGNVLAYTKMSAISISGATGGAYQWNT
ncbi:hypothetical protein BH09ACT6_BH09ACT6_12120 [soil metagenome]